LDEGVGVAALITAAAPTKARGELDSTASPSNDQFTDSDRLRAFRPRGRIAVVLHLYYPELWPEFRHGLAAIPEPYDLFVTLTAGYSDMAADWICLDNPDAQIITLENRGRDILPFVTLINTGVLFKYELVCKLHSKRSLHCTEGDNWRHNLISGILCDTENVARILRAFDSNSDLGMVAPNGSLRDDAEGWSKHLDGVNELARRISMPIVGAVSGFSKFPAGSIFWIRASLLRSIAQLGLTPSEFEPEPIPPNARMPHVIERLFGHLCREAGMSIAESSDLFGMQKGVASTTLGVPGRELKPVDF